MKKRVALPLTLTALALVLAACAPEPTTQLGTGAPVASATPDGAATQPSASSEPATVAEASCDNILTDSFATALKDQGWNFRESPFFAGDLKLEEGFQCTWGNFEAPSNDNVQIFGWAPIAADVAKTSIQDLVDGGWKLEEESGVTYVTQDPATARILDDAGYGMTYAFRDGYVTFADTKQSLVLIVAPA